MATWETWSTHYNLLFLGFRSLIHNALTNLVLIRITGDERIYGEGSVNLITQEFHIIDPWGRHVQWDEAELENDEGFDPFMIQFESISDQTLDDNNCQGYTYSANPFWFEQFLEEEDGSGIKKVKIN